jgi:hypothetical protein
MTFLLEKFQWRSSKEDIFKATVGNKSFNEIKNGNLS